MGDRRNGAGRRAADGIVKLPWMQFYIDDWTTSTKVRLMGPVARAWYMELLILQWRDGYIPESERILFGILRSIPRDPDILAAEVPFEERDSNDYSAILKQVLECFEMDGEGHLVNRRLQELRNKKLAEYTGKSQGGGNHRGKRPDSERIQGVDSESDTDTEKIKPLVAKATRKQLPPDFTWKEHHKTFADRLSVCLEEEFAKFCDHHRAKGNVMKDWDLALNNWLRNAAGRYRSNGNGNRQSAFERVADEVREAD